MSGKVVITGSDIHGGKAAVMSNVPVHASDSGFKSEQDGLVLRGAGARSSQISDSRIEAGRYGVDAQDNRQRLISEFRTNWPALQKVGDPEIIAAAQVVADATPDNALQAFWDTALASAASAIGEKTAVDVLEWLLTVLQMK